MPLDAKDKIDLESLQNRFTYHPPVGDQEQRYRDIREAAFGFAQLLMNHCPSSPERSTALTRLDEAVMHANAAIARQLQAG